MAMIRVLTFYQGYSKKLFEELVLDEEKHYGQYDNEFDNLERCGNQYFTLQSIERSKNISIPGNEI